jgi:hypothetical protein
MSDSDSGDEFDTYLVSYFRSESISDPDSEDEAGAYVVSAGDLYLSLIQPLRMQNDSDSEETGGVHRLDTDEVQDSFQRMEPTVIVIA